MENKINIAELLKDCPKGMELYSPIFGEVYLDKIRPHLAIVVTTDKEQGNFKEEFLYDGRYGMNGECMLFPSKGKTTWEGFQRPFKDGDIVVNASNKNSNAFIYAGEGSDYYKSYVGLHTGINPTLSTIKSYAWIRKQSGIRFATEEEKQKLFKAIEENGYEWNAETKTLDKIISKFKEGDIISNGHFIAIFHKFDDGHMYYKCWWDKNCGRSKFKTDFGIGFISEYSFASEKDREQLFRVIKENGYKWNSETKTLEKLIEPKFKVGDIVKSKNCHEAGNFSIVGVEEDRYLINIKNYCIEFKDQDNYKLVSNKFDINTLIPFESRVLVRNDIDRTWRPAVYGGYIKNHHDSFYVLGGNSWRQCIPYEGNKHLRCTTDDCDEYYKNW